MGAIGVEFDPNWSDSIFPRPVERQLVKFDRWDGETPLLSPSSPPPLLPSSPPPLLHSSTRASLPLLDPPLPSHCRAVRPSRMAGCVLGRDTTGCERVGGP